MAYEFKKLSDVTAVETLADTVNVLVEEDGVIKKAPKGKVGVKSWNDLEDKPFGTTTEMVEVVPQQTVKREYIDEDREVSVATIKFTKPLTDDTSINHIVVVNGEIVAEDYTVEVQRSDGVLVKTILFNYGGASVYYDYTTNSGYVEFPTDWESVSIAVSEKYVTVKPMDEKYTTLCIAYDDDGWAYCDKTFDEIKPMFAFDDYDKFKYIPVVVAHWLNDDELYEFIYPYSFKLVNDVFTVYLDSEKTRYIEYSADGWNVNI